MIRLRPFRNDDPPSLAAVWRSQPPCRGLVQPMTPVLLDELVLCKPYFDRRGLIVAERDGAVVGFVHAAFAANQAGTGEDRSRGIICLLLVAPGSQQQEIAEQLVAAAESHFRQHGALEVEGGAAGRQAPFYHGLYGGATPAGFLQSDPLPHGVLLAAGYRETGRRRILQRKLVGFRPPIDREIMQLRRKHKVERVPQPQPRDWWAACTWGQLDMLRYALRQGSATVGHLCFWDMEPLASSWGVHASGLLDWQVPPAAAGPLLVFFLGEAMRDMQAHGATLVEVQCADQTGTLDETCRRLGFEEVDLGITYHKRLIE